MSQFQYPVAQCGQGAAKASFTTAATVITAAAVYKIPANTLWVGKMYRVTANIALGNVVTAQPTFTFQVMGGPTSNIILWSSGALTATTTVHAAFPCKVVVDLMCTTIGGTTTANFTTFGQVTALGLVLSGAAADPTTTMSTFILPSATVAVPSSGAAGFNSQVDTVLDFFIGCSASDPANTARVWQYYVEDLNGTSF